MQALPSIPHTANITLEWLDQRFPGRLISWQRDPEWSPHSPKFNPPDVYPWYLLQKKFIKIIPKLLLI